MVEEFAFKPVAARLAGVLLRLHGGAGAAGAAGSASDLSFALELDHSGASHLENELALPGGNVSASLRFRGETATLQDWPSDQGALLIKSAATPVAQLEAPFTDGTRAVGFTSTETTYIAQSAEPGEVGADDFALELVLRAAPGATIMAKRTALAGWSLALDSDGALTLDVADEQLTLQIASQDWLDMLSGKQSGQMLFMSGKLKVKGDMGLAMKLGSMFSM